MQKDHDRPAAGRRRVVARPGRASPPYKNRPRPRQRGDAWAAPSGTCIFGLTLLCVPFLGRIGRRTWAPSSASSADRPRQAGPRQMATRSRRARPAGSCSCSQLTEDKFLAAVTGAQRDARDAPTSRRSRRRTSSTPSGQKAQQGLRALTDAFVRPSRRAGRVAQMPPRRPLRIAASAYANIVVQSSFNAKTTVQPSSAASARHSPRPSS